MHWIYSILAKVQQTNNIFTDMVAMVRLEMLEQSLGVMSYESVSYEVDGWITHLHGVDTVQSLT